MFDKFFHSRLKRRLSPYAWAVKICSWLTLVLFSLLLIVFVFGPIINKIGAAGRFILFVSGHLDSSLRQTDNRTNILLMGVAGGNHDGPLLTDTIMLVSLDIKNHDAALITVPRDIWINALNGKINEAYTLGEEKRKGAGLVLSKASVGDILNIPIHYAFVIDFKAFSDAVNLVGGVDVYVENAFDDYQYPITGRENDDCNGDPAFACRFEHIHFNKGLQHMDGKTALQFVRSRHAQGAEGTDFARSRRQIKVIEALKNKITEPKVFLNPAKLAQLSQQFKNDTNTDLTPGQELFLAKNLINFNPNKIRTMSLDTGTEEKPGLLINPPISDQYGGAWVLIPRSGNWREIQNKIKEFLQL
ncbi:MAG: LCP family protein [Patescibacteria group bacterium]|nr:LCP family protein [Patescibacteria group bacterium]